MRFCEDHWASLTGELEYAGLGSLMMIDGEEGARRRLDSYHELGEWTLDNYDPLLAAQLNIAVNLVAAMGRRLLDVQAVDPHCCGLCYANAEHAISCDDRSCAAYPFDSYIDWAVRDEVENWLEMSAK
jgi:hypothetical protein